MSKKFCDAVTYGPINEVKRMLKEDPSLVHWRDEYEFTALHGAAGEEDVEIIRFLVDNGADVDAQNEDGISPLHICLYPEIARELIACGANIELQDKWGRTPLMTLSSELEREDVIQVLLEAGANVNTKDKDGITALLTAIARGENVKVNLLRKFGAK